MKFGPLPLEEAEGKILGHHITAPDGRRALRKGKPLTAADVDRLRQLGRKSVYAAELEPDDVSEDCAAERVARAVMGENLRATKPSAGRVNLRATRLGVVQVDVGQLIDLNSCEGITLATMATGSVARPRETVATVKVIPFAVPEAAVLLAEDTGRKGGALIRLLPLVARNVGLILSGSPAARSRVEAAFEPPLKARLEGLGSGIRSLQFVPLEDEKGEQELAQTLRKEVAEGSELILLAGETAIMDRHDIAARAIERAGGVVACFGAPVDPGNLLMLAYIGHVPVVGAPGCARSRKINVLDWVLPRLLAGEHLSRADIFALGHGGLLEDTSQRPMPRNRLV